MSPSDWKQALRIFTIDDLRGGLQMLDLIEKFVTAETWAESKSILARNPELANGGRPWAVGQSGYLTSLPKDKGYSTDFLHSSGEKMPSISGGLLR